MMRRPLVGGERREEDVEHDVGDEDTGDADDEHDDEQESEGKKVGNVVATARHAYVTIRPFIPRAR